MQNVPFTDPHLHKKLKKYDHFPRTKRKLGKRINTKLCLYPTTNRIFRFPDSQIWKIICLKDARIIFLYCLKYVGNSWEVCGSRFWQNILSSINHPKSIGIGPGTLISNFWNNWNPIKQKKEWTKYPTNRANYFCLFPPIGAPLEPHSYP